MKTSVQHLHERAMTSARNYLRAESELITILQEMDRCRGYREFGARSLFEYSTQVLGLSESVTLNLTSVARKAVEVPALKEMIAEKKITLSNARAIVPVLTPENQTHWLESAATLSKRELEREIAQTFPERSILERVKPVSAERYEVRLGISAELHEKLKRVQDLLSSRKKKAVGLEEVLEVLADAYVEREDPVVKAKRIEAGKAPQQSERTEADSRNIHVPGQAPRDLRFIPAPLKRQLDLRDGGQCTVQGLDGSRCPERRWIDYHPIVPVSCGGRTTLGNLTTLCRGHHRLRHARKGAGQT